MNTYLYEVVREYVLVVEGLEHSVKGRVSRLIKDAGVEEYSWDISHHYRPSEKAGGVYYPDKETTNSFDETEFLLFAYMTGFTTIDVTPNELY
ncbi:MAG: hypothetical protein JW883_04375 [Deltaproteobacteria bacterium]|nr:hypothetical protein [Deltaproteobacteria bacterium]